MKIPKLTSGEILFGLVFLVFLVLSPALTLSITFGCAIGFVLALPTHWGHWWLKGYWLEYQMTRRIKRAIMSSLRWIPYHIMR